MTQAYSEELLSHLVELRGLQLATTWCDHVRWYEIDTTEDLQVQSDFSVERKVEACLEKGENSMLKYLWDPANAITTGGLLFSSLSLFLALSNRLELSIATALWAVLSDHLDGIVAAHTKHRHPDVAKMGKSLDGFADIMYGAVLPAVILIQLSGASVFALVAGTTLLAAGAIRLSYFANFGRLRDGRFLGVPLSYDIPVMAIIFLARPLVPDEFFVHFTLSTFVLLAGLHVAPIRVPAPNMTMYVAISLFAVTASSALGLRGLS